MFIWLIYLLAIVIEGVAIYFFYTKKKIYDLILNTETSSVTTLREGYAEVKGTVEVIEQQLKSL